MILQLVIGTGCTSNNNKADAPEIVDSFAVNASHLDHLYIPVTFEDSTHAGAISIYAEAPDYHLMDAVGEGIACVDDISRAALFYGRSKNILSDTISSQKLFKLIQFILSMQSANGYFYNFVLTGGRINKEGKTSANTANWWSWRALQTLSELNPIIIKLDKVLSKKIDTSLALLLTKIKHDLLPLSMITKDVDGIKVPLWLPGGSASDQSAILILGLINYCTAHPDSDVKNYIRKLANGIAMLQSGNESNFPYFCFLSWENVWHAYGSDQAFAMLQAGEFLSDSTYIKKGIAEVEHFYPWLLRQNMLSSFNVHRERDSVVMSDQKQYPQIAYGIRPMIFASVAAYKVTKNKKFAILAEELAAWFTGRNVTKTIMYDMHTGRCFDGIQPANKVNRNAGAESTIEALLAMQEIQKLRVLLSDSLHQE